MTVLTLRDKEDVHHDDEICSLYYGSWKCLNVYMEYFYVCTMYVVFWNTIGIIMRHDCRDYTDFLNQLEDVCRSYKTFTANVYLIKN